MVQRNVRHSNNSPEHRARPMVSSPLAQVAYFRALPVPEQKDGTFPTSMQRNWGENGANSPI